MDRSDLPNFPGPTNPREARPPPTPELDHEEDSRMTTARARRVPSSPDLPYPCPLSTAPDGSLFVAVDPMDQVGPYESMDGKIYLYRDGKDPVVFAEGFRAVFGMAFRDGELYVSHMPFLTVL